MVTAVKTSNLAVLKFIFGIRKDVEMVGTGGHLESKGL
jgi:hypothetical protein